MSILSRLSGLPIALLFCPLALADAPDQGDANAREFIVATGPLHVAAETPLDAISREFVVGTGGLYQDNPQPEDAISREFVAGIGGLYDSVPQQTDAIAREFVIGLGERYRVAVTDAIAREFAVETPLPDLYPDLLEAIGQFAPGGELTVSWRVANIGAAPAHAPWFDTVRLSPNEAPGEDAIVLGTVSNETTLAPDSSYDGEAVFVIPESLEEGEYWIILVVDSEESVLESNAENNTRTVGPFLIAAEEPTPDEGASHWLVHE